MFNNPAFTDFFLFHPLHTPLYAFLKFAADSSLNKKVLDCGAGGRNTPLAFFSYLGFDSHGVDISAPLLEQARTTLQEKGLSATFLEADIRELPFEAASFNFVSSINTLVHLPKKNLVNALQEMERVLRREGLMFINLNTVDTPGISFPGNSHEIVSAGENGSEEVHSFYEEDEVDPLLENFEILWKEKRVITTPVSRLPSYEWPWKTGDVNYILKKR